MKTIVLGAGLLGLSAAHALDLRCHEVVLRTGPVGELSDLVGVTRPGATAIRRG